MASKVNARTLLEEIRTTIGSHPVFKNNTEDLVNAANQIVSDNGRSMMFMGPNAQLFIDQYRAVIKFIYLYSSTENVSSQTKTEIYNGVEYIFEICLKFFTPVRNFLEQCELGIAQIECIEGVYTEVNHNSYSDYVRVADRIKANRGEKDDFDITEKLIRQFIATPKNMFKNQYVQALARQSYDMMIKHSEIRFDYDFPDFNYSDLLKFCSAIYVISSYYWISLIRTPSLEIKIPKDVFHYYIRLLSKLSDDKIERFMSYLNYDINYQKDKLTLIQPFFAFGDNYSFCPLIVKMSYLPIKLYRVIIDTSNGKYEKDVTKIAKLKETDMLNELKGIFSRYNCKTSIGYKILDNQNRPKAEYDLIIYDEGANELYVCECKWFFVGDGERDHFKLTNRIEMHAKNRIKQDDVLKNNITSLMRDEFSTDKIPISIKSLMISQNFMGNRQMPMPVIDVRELKDAQEKCVSLHDFMEYLINEKYRDEHEISNGFVDYQFNKYRFRIEQIYIKMPEFIK